MLKKFTKFTSVLLVIVILTGMMLSACSYQSEGDHEETSASALEENFVEAMANFIPYSSDGLYETTLLLNDGNFDGVTAEDVEVKYLLTETAPADGDETWIENAKTKDAEVLSASVNKDGSLTVSFHDPNAAENKTPFYGVLIRKLAVGAVVKVEPKAFRITCDRDYVVSTENSIKLTFTLEEGEFESDIEKDDITLASSFENLTVESVSAAGKNLTLQLSGEIGFHESSNAWLDGMVTLSEDAIKDSLRPVCVRVPVMAQAVFFDAERLEASNGKITVPLVLAGLDEAGALTAEDIALRGADAVTVESVTPVGEDEVLVVMSAPGVEDRNQAAALLENAVAQVKGWELSAGFMPAGFYPVFDYVDEKDGNLEITTILYAENGSFAEDLSASAVQFAGDFEDAKVVSLNRTGDVTAELVFQTPAKGQTTETIDQDGEIILTSGALINRWGQAKEDDTGYLRNYSVENYGRAAGEGLDILGGLAELSDLTGKITSVVDLASTAYDAANWVLNLAGVVTAEESVDLVAEIQKANSRLDQIQRQLAEQNTLLHQILEQNIKESVGNFNVLLTDLEQACARADQYVAQSADHYERPTVKPRQKDADGNELPYDDQPWIDYSRAVVAEMSQYNEYNETIRQIRNDFNSVISNLQKDAAINPVCLFDQLCTKNVNFDTQCIRPRLNYRYRIAGVMERALFHIILYYGYGYPDKVDNVAIDSYKAAFKLVDQQLNAYKIEFPANEYIETQCTFEVDGFSIQYMRAVGGEGLVPFGAPNMADRYAYCYVLGRKVNMDRLRAYTLEEINKSKSEKSISAFDFTEEQRNEFLSRMQGRTLREELKSAFFGDGNQPVVTKFTKNYPYAQIDFDLALDDKTGIVFSMAAERSDYLGDQFKKLFGLANSQDYRWYTNADFIKWDDTSYTYMPIAANGQIGHSEYAVLWLELSATSFTEFILQ